MDFTLLLDNLVNMGEGMYLAMNEIVQFMLSPLGDVVDIISEWCSEIPALVPFLLPAVTILHLINEISIIVGLGDFTLATFMFGAGLIIYIIWQLVTWVLNIVT